MKMLVFDLDGTLLDRDKKISDNTKKYLNTLKDKGYILVIATARIYESIVMATDGATFANYIISDTGSCIYDVNTGKTIMKKLIPNEIVKKIFKYYNDACRYIDFCSKDYIYKYSVVKEDLKIIKMIENEDSIFDNGIEIYHIVISMKGDKSVLKLYHELLKDIPELDILIMRDSFSDKNWIEIFPKGCSKYNAISKLSELLNINHSEIIAFGDSLNDIEMLQKCGYGVSLINALDEVKQVSDAVTKYDHNHDGVIQFLKKYLDEK